VTASGYRGPLKKLSHSFQKLWKFYCVVGVLAVLALLAAVALGSLTLTTLPTVIVLLSNTYGLIAILLLLGYGLVYVPKSLWRYGDEARRAGFVYGNVGRSYVRFEKSVRALRHVLDVLLFTQRSVPVGGAGGRVREDVDDCVRWAGLVSPIAVCVDSGAQIVDDGVDGVDGVDASRRRHRQVLRQQSIDVEMVERLSERDLDYGGDEEGIAMLRERVQRSVAECVGSRGEYVGYVEEAFGLVDDSPGKSRRVGAMVSAVLAAATSAVVVWCEATIATGKHPDLSPLSLMIRDKQVQSSLWGLQVLVAMPLAYCAYATFYSLFELSGLFSLKSYHMVARGTHSWSLLLNASLLCRFAAPLAFNYLHVVRMTGHQRGGQALVFTSGVYGLADVPLLGTRFNAWFPLLLVVYVGLLVTGVFEKVSGFFGFVRQEDSGEGRRIGEARVKVELEAIAQGGSIGADVIGEVAGIVAGGDVELGRRAGGRGGTPKGGRAATAATAATVSATAGSFRYTYDEPTQRVGAPEDGRRVGGADAADETDELFSNIGR